MGTGKGLLDSLIAEGGLKSREFIGYPYFNFYLEVIFCAHLFPFFFFVISYSYIEIHNITFKK